MLQWRAQLSVSVDNHQFVRERPSGRVLTMPSAATPEGGERQIFADFMKFQLPHPHDVAGRIQRPQLGHRCSGRIAIVFACRSDACSLAWAWWLPGRRQGRMSNCPPG